MTIPWVVPAIQQSQIRPQFNRHFTHPHMIKTNLSLRDYWADLGKYHPHALPDLVPNALRCVVKGLKHFTIGDTDLSKKKSLSEDDELLKLEKPKKRSRIRLTRFQRSVMFQPEEEAPVAMTFEELEEWRTRTMARVKQERREALKRIQRARRLAMLGLTENDILQDGMSEDASGRCVFTRSEVESELEAIEEEEESEEESEDDEAFDIEMEGVDKDGKPRKSPAEMQKMIDDLQAELVKLGSEAADVIRQTDIQLRRRDRLHLKKEVKKQQHDELSQSLDFATLLTGFMDDPERSVEDLQKMNTYLMENIRNSASEWDSVRSGWVQQYQQALISSRGERSLHHQAKTQLAEVRKGLAAVSEELKTKQLLYQQAQSEYDSINKQNSRTDYVKKICEMHSNISNQRADMEKTISDIKHLLGECIQAEERLGRIYKDAIHMTAVAQRESEAPVDSESPELAVQAGLKIIHRNYTKISNLYAAICRMMNDILNSEKSVEESRKFDIASKCKMIDQFAVYLLYRLFI
ncbi:putative Protein of unknown function (DUF812) [Monocercomonoides exilis]|uniref:putative Protein of unknown function (DUF812) n=1 Tax=Monocercomonoides exilis TaxID=2049356 RepID=UPI00355A6380|nr:putative Protein of unknown function (DUF812) [Monocercomonoides exilis]|eukprot:MONOS_12928.1-p1 / transcript=MONOS_12928.1 / gene=MONOS_12928 / organism=Monocercomonoides_exilis_PA203 / gene_product=unspecified product / transcript_product=unspecified product / location=Mono_scaffold00754:2891-4996(-) / protein_length=522 / sequence_SO=supercontig / SO=protein_coding / is_pseudo=false